MDGVRYWMGTKSLNPRVFPTDSWEEQAFAEDAGGALGGCVWPPRSYSCSFCRRDFRSAQALGGHMNVHRRDRARLKQSPAAELVPQNHALNGCTSLDSPYSTQMCTFLFGNPNPQFIRVSSPPPKEENLSSDLRFFSTRGDKGSLVSSDPLSWSSFLSGKRDRDLDEVIENGEKKYAVAVLDSRVEKEDCITEDLSMSLNLWRTDTCKDEEVASCKRRRIEAKPLGFLPKLKVCSSSPADDLDLELRLGDAPKMQRDLQFLGEYHDYFSLMNSYKI